MGRGQRQGGGQGLALTDWAMVMGMEKEREREREREMEREQALWGWLERVGACFCLEVGVASFWAEGAEARGKGHQR